MIRNYFKESTIFIEINRSQKKSATTRSMYKLLARYVHESNSNEKTHDYRHH